MLSRQFAQAHQPVGGRYVDPAFALNGFQNHRRRKIHARAVVVQQSFEILDGIQTF